MIVLKLPTLDVTRLAADYSAAVRAALTDNQLLSVQQRNAAETHEHVDHVHDFIDANDLMVEAVSLQLGDGWRYTDDDVLDAICIAQKRASASGYRLSRILIACEFSGIVRDEMTKRGHSAISCDLLETESPGAHYVGDVRDIMNDGYHLMIAHPPCTYLCSSALWRGKPNKDGEWTKGRDPSRAAKTEESLQFARDLFAADVPRKVIENPVGAMAWIRKATQFIQPYMFGDDASKNTGLWMEGCDALEVPPQSEWVPPRIIEYRGKQVKRWGNQSPCGADNTPEGPDRWKKRSRTFPGIANALATQLTGIAA